MSHLSHELTELWFNYASASGTTEVTATEVFELQVRLKLGRGRMKVVGFSK